MGLFKKNPFGHILFLKRFLIRVLGTLTHSRFKGFNKLEIEGSEIIKDLPETNVLFVSNHQTYFADVVAMFHVFNASLSGRVDSIKNIGYLWKRRSQHGCGGPTGMRRSQDQSRMRQSQEEDKGLYYRKILRDGMILRNDITGYM